MIQQIVIITGAAPIGDAIARAIPPDADVIAVDGGLDHALAAGLTPSRLVGDLDSVTADGLAWAARHAEIVRHPTDKDHTDTELALALAATLDPERLTLVGGGDRLDHTMAGIGALGALTLTSVPVLEAWWDGQHVRVIHGPGSAALDLEAGSTVSLLALHGECGNVSIRGTRWPLDGAHLGAAVGLGVSNVVTERPVTVSLSTGVLTVFDVPTPPTDADEEVVR